MVLPPQGDTQRETQPAQPLTREVIYIIDTSGSMAGTSIRQAKQALLLALERLRPGDRFNVIAFNSVTDQLFSSAVPADSYNLQQARRYVNGLQANGGTEMLPALRTALKQQETSGVRQIIFLTDGSVGNEAALFSLIHQRLGDSRLFTIGIGSAPNSHFMSKAAEFGRGTFTYIGDTSQVQNQMAALFQKLESPLMTDLAIDSGNAAVEIYPARLPDLYQGEPLIVSFKSDANMQSLKVSGSRQQELWQNTIQLGNATPGKGIGTLWARRKIAALMDESYRGAKQEQTKQQIVNVALQHHLVSKYTSLVAVDVTSSRPDSERLDQQAMPVNLSQGQVFEKIFGHYAQTATTAPLNLLLGALLLLSAILLRQTKGV
jgi:Ca-activated chloride channel family protein